MQIISGLAGWKKVVSALSDDALVSEARRYAGNEREQTAWLVAHMAEIYRRELSLKRACSRMVEFACEEFKLSSRQAWYRVAAARLALQVPDTIEKLASGELTLCSAETLFRTLEEAKKVSAAPVIKHDPIAPAFALDLPVTPAPAAPTAQEKRELFNQILGQTQQESVRKMDAWKCERAGVKSLPKPRPPAGRKFVGGDWWELSFSKNGVKLGDWDRLRDLLSHKLGSRDPNEVMDWLVQLGLEKVDPVRQEARKEKRDAAKAKKESARNAAVKTEAAKTEAPQVAETPNAAARLQFVNELRQGKTLRVVIPAPIRRRIFIRFNGRCQFVDRKSGRKCNSTAFVDIDHIIALADGGTNDENNLTLACASHNRRRYFWPATDQPLYAVLAKSGQRAPQG